MSLMNENYNSEDLLRDDPIWLFEQDVMQMASLKQTPVRKPMTRWFVALFAVVSLLSAGLFHKYNDDGDKSAMNAYFLVELRVIDNKGHPVAGAAIDIDAPAGGVTDTFGEWRSFLRLMPGGKLKVKISRAIAGKKIELQRTVSIPDLKSKGQEPNIKINIAFTKDVPVKRAETLTSSVKSGTTAAKTPAQEQTSPAFKEDDFSTVSLRFVRPTLTGYDASQMRGQIGLADDLLPVLKKQLSVFGVTVLERTKGDIDLSLAYVPVTGHPGLVMVSVEYKGDDKLHRASFIKDAGEAPIQLANRIVSSIKIHLPKTYRIYKEKDAWYALQPSRALGLWRLTEGQILLDPERQGFSLIDETAKGGYQRLRVMTGRDEPCNGKLDGNYCVLTVSTLRDAPPITGWKLLRLKVTDKLPQGAQLFASGFEATQVAPSVWEYWGEPGNSHNITIVASGRVLLRSRLKDPLGGIALLGGTEAPAKKRSRM